MIKLTAPTKAFNICPLTLISPLLSKPNVEFALFQNITSFNLFNLAKFPAVFKPTNSLDIGLPKTSKFLPSIARVLSVDLGLVTCLTKIMIII